MIWSGNWEVPSRYLVGTRWYSVCTSRYCIGTEQYRTVPYRNVTNRLAYRGITVPVEYSTV